MTDQYFNFNFPTQSVGMILTCENIHCSKLSNNTYRTSANPSMCSCCYKLFCSACFQTPTYHQCEIKTIINTDYITLTPCSRCKIKQSTLMCVKCNSKEFCKECCRIVHSIKKFSFHPVTQINLVGKQNSINKKITQENIKETVTKMHHNNNHYHKKSPSYVQLELLNNLNYLNNFEYKQQQQFLYNNIQSSNDNTTQQQLSYIDSIDSLSKKVQLFQTMMGLKKSQMKLAQLCVKEKWQKISTSIQSTFKITQQKLRQKQCAIRLHIQRQLQTSMKQITSINDQLQQFQLEINNVKLLIEKNIKTNSLNNSNNNNSNNNNNNNDQTTNIILINEKFINCQNKLDIMKSPNSLIDTKTQLSKQFTQLFKRIQHQIDTINANKCCINNNNDQQKPLVRNFDQISFTSNKIRDKKKQPFMINTSTKYHKKTDHTNTLTTTKTDHTNTLTTTKKHFNNISFSHQLNYSTNDNLVNAKNKKRKTSIELYEMTSNNHNKQGIILQGDKKTKQLQRIKSFDYLSSTVASLSSSSQIQTQKKPIEKIKKQAMMINNSNNNNSINNRNNKNDNNRNANLDISINENIKDNTNSTSNGMNTIISELKLDSKRQYDSTQQLSINSKRNETITNNNETSIFVQQIQSMNFLQTSSQLLPSLQTLPTASVIQTTRSKQSLHYGSMVILNSAKSNIGHYYQHQQHQNNTTSISVSINSNLQHNININRTKHNNQNNNNTINSNNKTFSGTTLTSSIKSPTNKITTSTFKSPKVKLRYINQTKQSSFNQLSQQLNTNVNLNVSANANCSGVNSYLKQRTTIKKVISSKVLANLNKE